MWNELPVLIVLPSFVMDILLLSLLIVEDTNAASRVPVPVTTGIVRKFNRDVQ
jgi:hypothetical protein